MDFTIPDELAEDLACFEEFLAEHLVPHLASWQRAGQVAPDFYRAMGAAGWFGRRSAGGRLQGRSAFWEALIAERLAKASPGVAIAVLAHVDLGLMGLHLFGSAALQVRYARPAAGGEILLCLGNTENVAGSDVAGIRATAVKTDGGWVLNGTKAFESADLYARMEAARLMLHKACATADEGRDFRLEASMAKYLAVAVARETTAWSADLFGAASVMAGHPIHKFPLDAWAASLGEGTEDVQKLVIFREMRKRGAG